MENQEPKKPKVDPATMERLAQLVDILRDYIQDDEKTNHLLEDVEFSDQKL